MATELNAGNGSSLRVLVNRLDVHPQKAGRDRTMPGVVPPVSETLPIPEAEHALARRWPHAICTASSVTLLRLIKATSPGTQWSRLPVVVETALSALKSGDQARSAGPSRRVHTTVRKARQDAPRGR
jgi:hypothetical protein